MAVHEILPTAGETNAGVLTFPYQPAAIDLQGNKGAMGRFYIAVHTFRAGVVTALTWTIDLRLYGRLSPEAPWHLLQTFTTAAPSTALGSSTAYNCPVYPHMKAELHNLMASTLLGNGVPDPGTWEITATAWMED